MQGNSSLYTSRYSKMSQEGGAVEPTAPASFNVYISGFNNKTVGDFKMPTTVSDVNVRDAVLRALDVSGNDAFSEGIQKIFDSQTSIAGGRTLHRIPESREILARIIAVREKSNIGVSDAEVFTSKAYLDVSDGKIQHLKAYALMDSAKAAAWDAKVKEILSKLADYRAPGTGTEKLEERNKLNGPFLVTKGSISNYPADLQVKIKNARTPPTYGTAAAMGALRTFTVAQTVQNGGNVSAHAPLFPRMTMNGGAHPFATLSGGEVQPAQVLQNKIKTLLEQYKMVNNGVEINATLKQQISSYGDNVNAELVKVNEALKSLAVLNGSIAQNPPVAGYVVDIANVDALNAKAKELAKNAESASKKMMKLEDIAALLQELISKQMPPKYT